ncbi:ribbon-helix-helix domain-containing protein [Sphingomonas hengshuiensis]|uniref:Addiction module antitoxin n=1 Tax=Sphingomonas hengshuiensis TaxID=1609977 RepID=A0A7U4LFL7_9SPHN|nr:addiction module antitoxin [Sphingomonas hengshuiensis]AJP72654.1 addiction module antitoxin [Sphingomonas hengshuiensis]
MSKPMNLNVRISGPLSDFVSRNVGEEGLYENVSEYVRDLIRRDKERVEREMFEALKAELQRAFASPEEDAVYVDRESFLERLRARHR